MQRHATARPKPAKASDWQKTNYAKLIRYMPSGMYFARIQIQGKMIRRSLKTNQLSVAKLRLADFDHTERKKAATLQAHTLGKMTFGQALEIFKSCLKADPTAKPLTKDYYEYSSRNVRLRPSSPVG